jgi:hypothetical protein
MAVTCLLLFSSDDRLLGLLHVTVSVLSLVCPDVLGKRSKQAIFSLHLRRGRRRSTAVLHQSTNTERSNVPLIKEETPFVKHIDVLGGNKILVTSAWK